MIKKYFLSVFFIFFLFSCSSDDTDDNSSQEVKIRVSNSSTVNFKDTTFDGVNFGDLDPDEKSEYKTFEKSYSYGAVSIEIDGEAYGWVPIDFVGETILESGNYTFEYSFNTETKVLRDKLIRD